MTDNAIVNWPWGEHYHMLNGFTFGMTLFLVAVVCAAIFSRFK